MDGVEIGGMRVWEAREALTNEHTSLLNTTSYTLSFGSDSITLSARELGVYIDAESSLALAASKTRKETPCTLFSQWTADAAALDRALQLVSEKAEREAVPAGVALDFTQSVPFVYRREREGADVDDSALRSMLVSAVASRESATIDVPVKAVAPAVTLEQVSEDRQLIAQFSTSFAKRPYSDADRVFNIKKAAAAIHGTVLLSGEEFDTNAVLGDRNEQNGWREAAGIRNGSYAQEYGGGVCQVSTTLFNAVMMADLTVTERHPHSWPMGYVDIGRDATISTGGKNFRFVNSTQHTLYICATVNEEEPDVTVSLYGSPLPDGQYIVVTSENTGSLELPPDEWMLDETLPAGTSVTAREARQGKTARTYKSYYAADGTLLSRETAYEDVYRSIPGLVYMSADLFYS